MAQNRRILPLVGLILLATVLGAACQLTTSPAPAPAAPGIGVTITATLCPNIVLDAGQSVLWTNEDEAEHVVRHLAAEGGGQFDSGELASGDSFSFTFVEAGQYVYACSADGKMTGTVTVE
jgi:plastocyanin